MFDIIWFFFQLCPLKLGYTLEWRCYYWSTTFVLWFLNWWIHPQPSKSFFTVLAVATEFRPCERHTSSLVTKASLFSEMSRKHSRPCDLYFLNASACADVLPTSYVAATMWCYKNKKRTFSSELRNEYCFYKEDFNPALWAIFSRSGISHCCHLLTT